MPKTPNKTVKVETLKTLLREWDERFKFCVIESDKYPRPSDARRGWTARYSSIARCINELREAINMDKPGE